MNDFPYKERKSSRSRTPQPGSSGKRRKFDNYRFALSTGMNWADLDKGVLYHIQEYRDKLDDRTVPKEQKPTQIRMTRLSNGELIGFADPEIVAERMKDPEPDPRY